MTTLRDAIESADPNPKYSAEQEASVREWCSDSIASVRRKFNLPIGRDNREAPRPTMHTEYWHGYADCLADMERRFGTPITPIS